MTTAYREGSVEQRRELLEEREALFAEPLAPCEPGCRAELEVLRRRLETAEDDPLDHVREGLRRYGMALEAGRAAGVQRQIKQRRAWIVVAAVAGAIVSFVGGRIAYQYATHDFLVNPCPNGIEDGRRHFVTRHDGMLGLAFGCEALTDADCRVPCSREGRCAAERGRCVARSSEDCRQSVVCRYHGECERRGDRCVVEHDDDCRASEGCRQDGTCALRGGRCAPASEGDCRLSARCAEEGFCRLGFDMCEQEDDPRRDECARISHCITVGLCTRDELPEGCSTPRASATASLEALEPEGERTEIATTSER